MKTKPEKYNSLSLDEITQAYEKIIEWTTENKLDSCKTCSLTQSRVYPQVKLNGVQYTASLVVFLYHKRVELGIKDFSLDEDLECSHLCNTPHCVNIHHLTIEDGEVNKSRLCCRLYKNMLGYRCPHEPTCLGCKPCFE